MKKHFLSGLICLCSLGCSGSSNSANDPVANPAALPAPTLIRSDFMRGLQNPWDLGFTQDGTLFFTEKCRGLSVRKPDGSIRRLFGTNGSSLVASDFFCEGQTGMNGLALDPDFQNNQTVYVYMSSNLGAPPKANRVVRLQLNANLTSVLNRTDIVTGIPFKAVANTWGAAGLHSGGRLRFGPDGFLYITTGDNHNGTLPQDLNRLGGKVLRVDRNGAAAPGNNTPAGGDPRIYTYGHRNVQGLTFYPRTGQAVICEHGPDHDDEITALRAGGNGGWDPKPEPGVTCADNYCGYISNKLDGTPTPMTDFEKFPQALPPLLDNADAEGMGPCTFLTGAQWKAWDGVLAVGIMGAERMDLVTWSGTGTASGVTTANLLRDRMRSLVQGPDGNLYVATDSGPIWKVTPR